MKIILLLLVLITIQLNSQKIIVDLGQNERVYSAIQLKNNNYIVGCHSIRFGFTESPDTHFHKINNESEVLWSTEDSTRYINYDVFKTLQLTDQDNFIILSSLYNDADIIMFSSEGEQLKSTRLTFDNIIEQNQLFAVDTFLLGFVSVRESTTASEVENYFIKISLQGEIIELIRNKNFSYYNPSRVTEIKYHKASNTIYVYWDYIDDTPIRFKKLLSKYDYNLDHIWTKEIGRSENPIGSISFDFTSKNHIILGFEEDKKPIEIILDLDGNEVTRIYGDKEYFDFRHFDVVNYNENTIFCGSAVEEEAFANVKFWLKVIDKDYNIILDTIWGRYGSHLTTILNNENGLHFFGSISTGCSEASPDINNCQDILIENHINLDEFNLLTKTTELFQFPNLNIYPNPSSGLFNIEYNNTTQSITNYKIYNSEMKLIQNFDFNNNHFDLTSQPNGLYYLEVHDNQNNRKVIEIIKSNTN